MNPEEKLLVPYGIECIAMNGFSAKMAAIQRHSKHIYFNAWASWAVVVRAHILARYNLKDKINVTISFIYLYLLSALSWSFWLAQGMILCTFYFSLQLKCTYHASKNNQIN